MRWVLLTSHLDKKQEIELSVVTSDGSSPEKSVPGRARALTSRSRAGPGLEPFFKGRASSRAGLRPFKPNPYK